MTLRRIIILALLLLLAQAVDPSTSLTLSDRLPVDGITNGAGSSQSEGTTVSATPGVAGGTGNTTNSTDPVVDDQPPTDSSNTTASTGTSTASSNPQKNAITAGVLTGGVILAAAGIAATVGIVTHAKNKNKRARAEQAVDQRAAGLQGQPLSDRRGKYLVKEQDSDDESQTSRRRRERDSTFDSRRLRYREEQMSVLILSDKFVLDQGDNNRIVGIKQEVMRQLQGDQRAERKINKELKRCEQTRFKNNMWKGELEAILRKQQRDSQREVAVLFQMLGKEKSNYKKVGLQNKIVKLEEEMKKREQELQQKVARENQGNNERKVELQEQKKVLQARMKERARNAIEQINQQRKGLGRQSIKDFTEEKKRKTKEEQRGISIEELQENVEELKRAKGSRGQNTYDLCIKVQGIIIEAIKGLGSHSSPSYTRTIRNLEELYESVCLPLHRKLKTIEQIMTKDRRDRRPERKREEEEVSSLSEARSRRSPESEDEANRRRKQRVLQKAIGDIKNGAAARTLTKKQCVQFINYINGEAILQRHYGEDPKIQRILQEALQLYSDTCKKRFGDLQAEDKDQLSPPPQTPQLSVSSLSESEEEDQAPNRQIGLKREACQKVMDGFQKVYEGNDFFTRPQCESAMLLIRSYYRGPQARDPEIQTCLRSIVRWHQIWCSRQFNLDGILKFFQTFVISDPPVFHEDQCELVQLNSYNPYEVLRFDEPIEKKNFFVPSFIGQQYLNKRLMVWDGLVWQPCFWSQEEISAVEDNEGKMLVVLGIIYKCTKGKLLPFVPLCKRLRRHVNERMKEDRIPHWQKPVVALPGEISLSPSPQQQAGANSLHQLRDKVVNRMRNTRQQGPDYCQQVQRLLSETRQLHSPADISAYELLEDYLQAFCPQAVLPLPRLRDSDVSIPQAQANHFKTNSIYTGQIDERFVVMKINRRKFKRSVIQLDRNGLPFRAALHFDPSHPVVRPETTSTGSQINVLRTRMTQFKNLINPKITSGVQLSIPECIALLRLLKQTPQNLPDQLVLLQELLEDLYYNDCYSQFNDAQFDQQPPFMIRRSDIQNNQPEKRRMYILDGQLYYAVKGGTLSRKCVLERNVGNLRHFSQTQSPDYKAMQAFKESVMPKLRNVVRLSLVECVSLLGLLNQIPTVVNQEASRLRAYLEDLFYSDCYYQYEDRRLKKQPTYIPRRSDQPCPKAAQMFLVIQKKGHQYVVLQQGLYIRRRLNRKLTDSTSQTNRPPNPIAQPQEMDRPPSIRPRSSRQDGPANLALLSQQGYP